MDAIVRRKVLGLVGLGIRGRRAVVGVQQVRDAARRGKLKLALNSYLVPLLRTDSEFFRFFGSAAGKPNGSAPPAEPKQ